MSLRKIIPFCLLLITCQISLIASPIKFIKNQGQWTDSSHFKVNVTNGALFYTDKGVVYNFLSGNYNELNQKYLLDKQKGLLKGKMPQVPLIDMHAFAINFLDANRVKPIGKNQNTQTENYFLGKHKENWKTNVRSYQKIRYNNLYDHIDLEYFATENNLKYEFFVAPGTSPNIIKLELKGAKALIDKNGNLIIQTSVGDKREIKPVSFQKVNGELKAIETSFVLEDNIISFQFPYGYDKDKELIIDPVLDFATYSGSTVNSELSSVAYDNLGQSHYTGNVLNINFPTTLGSYQQALNGLRDIVVRGYGSSGSNLLYSTFLGGADEDFGGSIAIGANNEIILAGNTASNNFPTTTSAYNVTYNQGGSDIYVAVLNSTGSSLLGSTYIGSSDFDGQIFTITKYDLVTNSIVVASTSSGSTASPFPTLQNSYQANSAGQQDIVIFRLDMSCSNLLASTSLGGNTLDAPADLFIDLNGNIFVTGTTASTNFPTTAGAYSPMTTPFFNLEAIAAKLDSNLSTLQASTHIGGTSDECGYHIKSDLNGDIYVCGTTNDGSWIPTTPGVYSNPTGRVFIQKFDSNLSNILAATKLGNLGAAPQLPIPISLFPLINNALPFAFEVDSCDNVYVALHTDAATTGSLPITTNPYQSTPSSLSWCELGPDFATLLHGSYIGSGTSDTVLNHCGQFDTENQNFYLAVQTNSANYYQSPGCFEPNNQSSSSDIAVLKLELDSKTISASFNWNNTASPDTVCLGDTVFFSANNATASSYNWDFGDNTSSTIAAPAHIYLQTGQYTVSLIITGSAIGGCSGAGSDTVTKIITVLEGLAPILTGVNDTLCGSDNTPIEVIVNNSNSSTNYSYSWTPAAGIVTGGNTANPTVNPNVSTTFGVEVTASSIGLCPSTSNATVNIAIGDTSNMQLSPDITSICEGSSTILTASGGVQYLWLSENSANNTLTVTPQDSRTYSVQITDALGCSATKTAQVNVEKVSANAGPDKFIQKGSSVNLNGSVLNGNSFFWLAAPSLDDINNLNTRVRPQKTTEYTLVAETPAGCKDTDKVLVRVAQIFIPNAFSPNGDAQNDIFRVHPDSRNELNGIFSLRIFNRWGQNIFATNNIEQGWDGTYQGRPCETGTYFYTISLNISEEEIEYKGDVSLLR